MDQQYVLYTEKLTEIQQKDKSSEKKFSSNANIFVLYYRHYPLCILPCNCIATCLCSSYVKVYSTTEQTNVIDIHVEIGRKQRKDVLQVLSKVTYRLDVSSSLSLLRSLYKLTDEGGEMKSVASFVTETARKCQKKIARSMLTEEIMERTHLFEKLVFFELMKNVKRRNVVVVSFRVLSATVC